MSQAKLTLRPPPNVDFVQGYPGIPPGPDRPQAAVKGAIEVRVGPGGVKAKWVRIELRKVETLPGGGLANTFFDFVGQSPVNLWQSGEEYSMLSTQDFPFSIRIPESIPPSIALEKGAGIKYELIATLCIKGKKGFLRRDKHVIVSTSAPIVIDKHELHSTWPVYVQPETRNTNLDGVTLIIERTNTCYGPGDRVAVMAVVRSESPQMVVLRGFEFSLRETTVFRAGPNTVGKKAAPQVKTGNVNEQKVPVNATLYSGMQHKAELSITVPSHHTSTTLNAARHIDITYVLTVRALLASGKPLVMDLPVIISNWPRSVSVEAVRRIGLAPNVSSHTTSAIAQQIIANNMSVTPSNPMSPTRQPNTHPYMNPAPIAPTTITDSSSEAATDLTRPNGNYATAPHAYGRAPADEFGARVRGASIDQAGSSPPQVQTIGGAQTVGGGATARPRSSGRPTAPPAHRLTATNWTADDMPEEVRTQNIARAAEEARQQHRRNTSTGSRPSTSGPRRGFMGAEEEKRMLYERAKAQVEQVQGVSRTQSPPLEVHSPKPVRDAGPILTAASESTSSKPSASGSRWMTAEEEKAKLFDRATDAVRRTQGLDDSNSIASPNNHNRSGSLSSVPVTSPGATLYAQAVSNMNRNASTGHSTQSAVPASPAPAKRGYMTAEEEKAQLRRYHDAKAAVDRNQNAAFDAVSPQQPPIQSPIQSPIPPPIQPPIQPPVSPFTPPNSAPIPYDALYPSSHPMASPPPPGAGGSQPSYLSEKEKLRRAYEAQDAAAYAARAAANPPPMQSPAPAPAPPPMDAPAYFPPTSPLPQVNGNSAFAEKERLRLQYAAQDAAAVSRTPPPATPPRGAAPPGGRGLPVPRAQPTPPAGGGSSSRPLTAAEEKARLRAMYESEERTSSPSPPRPPATYTNGSYSPNGANGLSAVDMERQTSLSSGSHYSDVPPPPPLMPKPPKEYMDETLQEDSAIAAQIQAMDAQHQQGVHVPNVPNGAPAAGAFAPYSPGFDARSMPMSVPPPPPLPPKLAMNDP